MVVYRQPSTLYLFPFVDHRMMERPASLLSLLSSSPMTLWWASVFRTVVTLLMATTYVFTRLPHNFPLRLIPSKTAKKKMAASSIYFQSLPYAITPDSYLIDYDNLAAQAKIFKPGLIICGASAYPRDWDYARLKAISEKEGAFLMADIAHTSGLVAAGELNDPFAFCDVVTTTTSV